MLQKITGKYVFSRIFWKFPDLFDRAERSGLFSDNWAGFIFVLPFLDLSLGLNSYCAIRVFKGVLAL